MKKDKVLFQYLREPNLDDIMPTRDTFKYMEYAISWIAWLPLPKDHSYLLFVLHKMWRMLLFTLALYLPIGMFLTYVLELNTFTPTELFNSVQSFMNTPGAFIKGVVTFLNLWRLNSLKDLMDKLDEKCISDAERIQVHRSARRGNSVFIFYKTVYDLFGTMTFLAGVLQGKAPLRIFNLFVDWRDGTLSFWIASTFEYILLMAAVLFNQLNDSIPFIFGLTIRTHMDLLRKRILNLRSDPNKSEEQDYEDLKGCISDHKLIEEACDLMRPYLSKVIFVQYLVVGIIFGLVMINLMFFANFWTGLASVAYTMGLLIQTFPFSYTCTLIDTDCDDLATSLFQSHWVDASRRYKSTLIYFMHNVQQNITFTAGSIFPICLNTNIKVAKLAFSVVTFVKEMNIAEKLNAL